MKQDNTVFFKRSAALPFVEMRKAAKSSACYHAHSHDEFSLGVIDKGTALYHNASQKNHIHKGDTITINPGDVHSCNPDSENWSYRMLFIDSHWMGRLQAEFTGATSLDYQTFTHLYESASHFYTDFHELFDTLLHEPNPLEAESRLIQSLEAFFHPTANIEKQANSASLASLTRVRERILDQLHDNLTLEALAQEAQLSRYHLIRCFKQRYGMTPHALQLDERIKKSKILLKSGQSILDTTAQLGFADQSHFQRNFKKRLAVTPKQYQAFFL